MSVHRITLDLDDDEYSAIANALAHHRDELNHRLYDLDLNLGLSSLRCPSGGSGWVKVLLSWKNRACLESSSSQAKEHLQGEYYRVVSTSSC